MFLGCRGNRGTWAKPKQTSNDHPSIVRNKRCSLWGQFGVFLWGKGDKQLTILLRAELNLDELYQTEWSMPCWAALCIRMLPFIAVKLKPVCDLCCVVFSIFSTLANTPPPHTHTPPLLLLLTGLQGRLSHGIIGVASICLSPVLHTHTYWNAQPSAQEQTFKS